MSEKKKQKLKEYQKKKIVQPKTKIKNFNFFLFIVQKMEQEDLYVGENGVIKNAFHQNKKPININEVDIKKIISDKKSYGSKDSFK